MSHKNVLFFYGHGPKNPHRTFSQHFPSPFHAPTPTFPSDGNETTADNPPNSPPTFNLYPTAEHYMMHAKALLFADATAAAAVLRSGTPAAAKQLGRGVRGFDEARWTAHREAIVAEGSWWKFGGALALALLVEGEGKEEREGLGGVSEEERALAEAWVAACGDGEREAVRAWGLELLRTGSKELVEASARDAIWGIGFGAANAPVDRKKWGLNLLGKALMATRDKLRERGAEALFAE